MTDPTSDDRPLVVISDLHLGRADMVAAAAELDELIDGASTLVINGDAAELHLDEHAAAAHREMDLLRDRCTTSNTRLVLLAGNHDPLIVPRRHLSLAQGAVLLTHGDAVHEALAPWSDTASVIARRHREVMRSHPESRRETLEVLFEACREAAVADTEVADEMGSPTTPLTALGKPWKLVSVLGFWFTHGRRLHRFATRFQPSARIVIAGHSHRGGVVNVGGRTIVNTGCFGIPGPALAVVASRDELEVRRIVRRRRGDRWFIDPMIVHAEHGIRITEDELPESDAPRRIAS